ncbi:protein phosphatase 2C domain-containing protein [Streptomyces sp. NRRL S-98]|uniref:protein phosphatase 2C domain-containing protein n=2 Tax=unclassified Streptomyces TaxID=2593676 RepID=UPI0004C8A139|nr:protein phosphatase 2C domain-containing protein [Streptomyces sp. NRRL S-98]
MSQQGADDWWQKLYEDPDAGPAPDPGDTLDHRFRSVAGVTADPAEAPPPAPHEPVREAEFGPGPGRGPLPAPRPEPDAGLPARPPLPDAVRREPPRPPAAGPVPAPRPAPDGPPAPPALPRTAEGAPPGGRSVPAQPPGPGFDQPVAQVPLPGETYGPPPAPSAAPDAAVHVPSPGERPGPPPAPPAAPPAVEGATSGPGFGPLAPPPARGVPSGAPAAPPHGPPPPPAAPPTPEAAAPPGERYVPPPPPAPPWHGAQPRDPRTGGATGYALGGVEVPPAPGPELPTRRAQAPRPEDRTEQVPQPAPPPEPVRAPAGAPAPEAAAPQQRPEVRHLGDRAPTYAAEPGGLPPADPAALDGLVPDTVLEGARYGGYTLRAASLRGDSARYRGETRRDFLLTARFGSGDDALVLVALAGGDRAAPGAAEAAAELCRTVAAAVGRSQGRLADDIRAGRRDALRSGLQRLTDRGYGRLRARAAELGLAEEAYTAGLRGLLLPVDPECRTRVCFGAGAGGLFRLRSGQWQDLEPAVPAAPAAPAPTPAPAYGSDEAPGEPGSPFRFRASLARPGDTLLLCSGGLAEPMREEAALQAELAARWGEPEPPGLAAFLADTQLRLKGYADDRTAAAVWEA